jgi:hypothetical protein
MVCFYTCALWLWSFAWKLKDINANNLYTSSSGQLNDRDKPRYWHLWVPSKNRISKTEAHYCQIRTIRPVTYITWCSHSELRHFMSIRIFLAVTWKFLPCTSYLKFTVQTVKFWMLQISSFVVLNCEKSQGYHTGLSVVQYLLLFLFKRSPVQCESVTVTMEIKSCLIWHLAHHRS